MLTVVMYGLRFYTNAINFNGSFRNFLNFHQYILIFEKVTLLGGGVLPEKLGMVVWPASQNLYPIYDQNLRFSLPYL